MLRVVVPSILAASLAVVLAGLPAWPHVAAQSPERGRAAARFARVVAQVAPSVVSIRVEVPSDADLDPVLRELFGDEPISGPLIGGASGFVVREDGSILTSHHVIERATRIHVRLGDGRELPATVVGTDPPTDLALLRVAAGRLRPLRFAPMDRHRVGDEVLAVGAPLGLDATASTGIVSALGRSGFGVSDIEDYVQTDASMHPGNSGGPIVDLDGRVVGVSTIIVADAPGVSFAVSAALAAPVTQQLLDDGRVHRAWIGAEHQELTPELALAVGAGDGARGALVSDMTPDGPAHRAGVQLGDAIIGVDGITLARDLDLTRTLIRSRIGATIELTIVRRGRERRLAVTTDEEPMRVAESRSLPASPSHEGEAADLDLVPVTPGVARAIGFEGREGAMVSLVREGGAAYRAGLRIGDVIVEADHSAMQGPEDLWPALSDDDVALLRVRRGDHAFYTVLRRR